MNLRSQAGTIPTWLKVMIGLFVVGLVGIIVLVVATLNMTGQLLNPDNAPKVGHKFVQMAEPLPAGWKYLSGLDMQYMKMVSLSHQSTGTIVILIEQPNSKHESAEQLASAHTNGGKAQKFVLESRGSGTFVGQPMAYVRGTSTTKSGTQQQMEMRFITLPSDRFATIAITELKSPPFNPALAQPLLERIKGFN